MEQYLLITEATNSTATIKVAIESTIGIQQHSQQQNVQYQSTNNSGNENDLFTPSEIIELTREIISKLSACRTRAEQFQIKYDIALFNETWLKPSVNSA